MRNIDHGVCYEQLLADYLQQPLRIADLGAGTGSITPRPTPRRAEVWGIDPDPRVKNNPNIDVAQIGLVEEMHFANHFFDIICSRFMFEHLPDPVKTLNVIYPWLKPGGKVLILTVNKLHYYHYLGKLLPQQLLPRLAGRRPADTFPTYYAFNNPRQIAYQVRQSRFGRNAHVKLILCEKYLYFSLAPLRLLARIYSLLVNTCAELRYLRAGLIIEITKTK